jgi:hypothetical protein
MPKRELSGYLLGFVPYRCMHCGIFSLFASLSFQLDFLRSFIFPIMLRVLLSLEFSFSTKFIILCATAGKLFTDMKYLDGRLGHDDF